MRPLLRCEKCQTHCHLCVDDDDGKGPKCRGAFGKEQHGALFYSVNSPRTYMCYFCRSNREEEKRPQSADSTPDSELSLRPPLPFRLNLDLAKPDTAQAKAEERFRFKLLPFDPEEPTAWKEAYKKARAVAGEVAERFRVAAKQESKRWWRAIIGMYPVHNLRHASRRSEGSDDEDDGTDGGAPDSFCEECE